MTSLCKCDTSTELSHTQYSTLIPHDNNHDCNVSSLWEKDFMESRNKIKMTSFNSLPRMLLRRRPVCCLALDWTTASTLLFTGYCDLHLCTENIIATHTTEPETISDFQWFYSYYKGFNALNRENFVILSPVARHLY